MLKPLGRKSYGSIGHLPNSRLGPADHCVPIGAAKICCEKARDKHDNIIVQEKLDGSCTAVALIDNNIHALGRAGWPATTSRYKQHHFFAEWVRQNEDRFRKILIEGERIVGEWIAQAHGTIYVLNGLEPFVAFDIMREQTRIPYKEFIDRIGGIFQVPHLLGTGEPISVEKAMRIHDFLRYPCDQTEGVVYRVERHGKIDFLAKWVRPDKIDGKYLPEISGLEAIWNWYPKKE